MKFLALLIVLLALCVWYSRDNKSKLQTYAIKTSVTPKSVAKISPHPAPSAPPKAVVNAPEMEVVTPGQNQTTDNTYLNDYNEASGTYDENANASRYLRHVTYKAPEMENDPMDVGPSEIYDTESTINREPAEE